MPVSAGTAKAVDSADYKILPYIPYPDICLEGLKKFGMSFVDKFAIFASIAPEVMTGELALHGVGLDASCLSLVPVELRTEAVLSLIHIFRESNITERSLVTRCELINSGRSDNNPHKYFCRI